MEPMVSALKDVDAAIAKKKPKERKRLAEIAGHVSSHFVLLKLQNISLQLAQKLSSFLRESLSTLYASVDRPALHLASTILHFVYHERLLPAFSNMCKDQQDLWESVLNSHLAGLLDFLDANDTKEVKEKIGSALYPSLCEVFFSLSAPKTSVDLRCTAYNLLSDSAASHPGNQERLRDREILGGERLGSCIWRTKDYLAMEGLLNLFARAIPSTHNSSSGRFKRTAYIHSVFKDCAPPEAITTGGKIAELLENVPTSNWDDTAPKVVDALARGNITYPQPFDVEEVTAYGHIYRSDRLYADDKALLANVLLSDDQYESLEIPYSTIHTASIGQSERDETRITVSVREPPRLGKDHIPAGETPGVTFVPEVAFAVRTSHVRKLMEAFRSRGLGDVIHDVAEPSQSLHVPKLSVAAKPAYLELDSAGRFVEELSQTERIENVSQFYRTDEPSDPIMSPGDAREFEAVTSARASPGKLSISCLPGGLSSASHAGKPPTEATESVAQAKHLPEGAPARHLATSGGTTLSRTGSHLVRAAAFGLSDEELSEISDYDSPLPRSKILRRSSTTTSLIRGRISFQPLLATSTGTSSSATRVARGGIGKVVLDSDDESPAAVLASPATRRAKKKAALIREPTIDDTQLAPLVLAPTHADARAPSAPAPITPSPLLGDARVVSSNGPDKVLRFSDIPAPNFNAALSSPAVVPKSALKSALVKKLAPSRLVEATDLDLPPSDSEPADVPTVVVKNLRTSAIQASDMLNDLAPMSSSPTPGAKKSVKAKLRKKEENPATAAKSTNPPSTKRKSDAASDLEEPESRAMVTGIVHTAKRSRTAALPAESPSPPPAASLVDKGSKPHLGIEDERSESQVLRPRATAATRATKKYHAKKGRASPPTAAPGSLRQATAPPVDYDALPSPPRPPAIAARSSSPVPKGKRAVKPKAKAPTKSENATKLEVDSKARDGTGEAPAKKPAGAAPARKARARARKNAGQDKSETRAVEAVATAPAVDLPRTAPDVPDPRLPQGAQRKKTSDASTEHAMSTIDGDADAGELPPIDEYMDDAAFPTIDFADPVAISTPRADPDVPKPASTTPQQLRAARQEIGGAVAPPDTSSKKTSATPWDVAFGSQLNVRPAPKAAPVSTAGKAPPPSAHDELMDIDDDRQSKLQPPIAESVVAIPEPVATKSVKSTAPAKGAVSLPTVRASETPMTSEAAPQEIGRIVMPAPKPAPAHTPVIMTKLETIDLTLDSPPNSTRRAVLPSRNELHPPSPPVVPVPAKIAPPKHKIVTTVDDDVVSAYPGLGRKARMREDYVPRLRPQAYTYETEPHPGGDLHGGGDVVQRHSDRLPQRDESGSTYQAPRERSVFAVSRASGDMEILKDEDSYRVADMLGRLHDAIVYNMENKFEGVRRHARLGRNDLVRSAVADLEFMRTESVAQFNKLVDLEAEYATSGRGVIRNSEDWVKTNEELSRSLTGVLEQHDRTMLSKKMPPNLISPML